ncbi:MAG: hypothetical protein K940chlam7_01056 [Chlamydiae bacterium]|nr:hypothetical protein [Chlamydiota bacterium]
MAKTIILAKRPDLVLQLEKYDLIPECKPGGTYVGCAKKWAQEGKTPYDTPTYQALAERLPTGWEELTLEEMNTLLEQLNIATERKMKANLDTPNRGGEVMLKNLTEIALLGFAIAASVIEESGLGILPNKDEAEVKLAKKFSFEIVLHLLTKTNVLTNIFRTIAQTTPTTEKNHKLIGDVLKLLAILLAIVTASNGNEDRLHALFTIFTPTIQEEIEKAEQYVSESLVEGTLKGTKGEGIALYLQQARIALELNDFDGFYTAFTGALELVGASPEQLNDNIKKVHELAETLQKAFTKGIDDETNKITVMSRVM